MPTHSLQHGAQQDTADRGRVTHNQISGVLLGRCAWSSPTGSLPFMVCGACSEVLVDQAPDLSLVDLWERCGANQVVSDFGWL